MRGVGAKEKQNNWLLLYPNPPPKPYPHVNRGRRSPREEGGDILKPSFKNFVTCCITHSFKTIAGSISQITNYQKDKLRNVQIHWNQGLSQARTNMSLFFLLLEFQEDQFKVLIEMPPNWAVFSPSKHFIAHSIQLIPLPVAKVGWYTRVRWGNKELLLHFWETWAPFVHLSSVHSVHGTNWGT